MAFSLSNWFKGKPEDDPDAPASLDATAPADAPPQSNRIPASVRSVTPNSVHSQAQNPVSLRDPSAPRVPISLPTAKPPSTGKLPPGAPQTRRVAAKIIGTPAEMRPTVPAYEPAFTPTAPDVTISLEIGDFLDRLPPNFLNAEPPDRRRKVEFQASELYSDLAKGRASVPASVIFRRCPEIFSRPVSDTEDVEVPLPLQKLVEQMGTALSTREDQYLEENVGEIETPFLQVAMEDNARVPAANGSAVGAVRPPAGLAAQSGFRPGVPPDEEANGEAPSPRPGRPGNVSAISPVKMPAEATPLAPPTAASAGPIINGKRPPSTVRASVAGSKIRVSGNTQAPRIGVVPGPEVPEAPAGDAPPSTHSQRIGLPMQPASPSHQVSKKTARIQIPPISLRANGPKVTPRVGAAPTPPKAPIPPPPSVPPTPALRANSEKDTAAPVTFRTSPPPSVKPVPLSFPPPKPPFFPPPAFPVVPSAAPAASAPAPLPVLAPADDRKIELGLAAILRGLPSSALTVEPSAVPDDVRVTLPFGLIEPQLSQGRVSIARDVFVSALPEAHRGVLSTDDSSAEIAIPLQEVFQNLPADALSLRADQVKEETGVYYPTPFSQKAEEDAQRFSPAAPVPAPASDAPATRIPAPEAAAAAGTPTDAPLDVAPPAPVSDVELPADTVPERDRDIPLDLEPAATPEPPPVAPVEARQKTPTPEVPVKEEPVAVLPALEAIPPAPEAPAPVAAEEKPPVPSAAELPAPAPEAIASPAVAKAEPAPAAVPAPVQDGVLQTLFMTEEELDAKTVVKLVCQLPSVTGCAIMFEDGLRLAGNFPDGDAQGFSAMSAPFYKRAARFVSELELGSLQTFTLHTEHGLLSFFMQDKICVGVRHTGRGFLPGIREKLEIVTRELARMYSNVAPGQTAQ